MAICEKLKAETMNPFQYPNQNEVLKANTERETMQDNVGKKIRFSLFDKRGFPTSEKVGQITGVSYFDYIVQSGKQKFLIPHEDYISIY